MSHLFYCQEHSLLAMNYGCHFPTEQWISDQPSQYAWEPETRKHHSALIWGWWHLILGGNTYHLCRAASQKPHSLKAFLCQQQAALKGITSFLATVDAFGLHVTFIPAPEAFTPSAASAGPGAMLSTGSAPPSWRGAAFTGGEGRFMAHPLPSPKMAAGASVRPWGGTSAEGAGRGGGRGSL